MSKQSTSIEDGAHRLSAELVGYLAKTDTHAEIITAALSRERLQALRDAARAACRDCGEMGRPERPMNLETGKFTSVDFYHYGDLCEASRIWDLIEAQKTT